MTLVDQKALSTGRKMDMLMQRMTELMSVLLKDFYFVMAVATMKDASTEIWKLVVSKEFQLMEMEH